MFYRLFLVLVLAAAAVFAQTQKDWMNEGIQHFNFGRTAQAQQAFQHAVNLNPSALEPHLYLGNVLLAQWIPGADGPENNEIARRAQAELETVLSLDPKNLTALVALASMSMAQVGPTRDPIAKERNMATATDMNHRIIALDPKNEQAYYNLGVLAWMKFYPELTASRTRLGMRPEDPGPLNDFKARQDLRSRLGDVVDEGIRNLEKALELDPQYDDAMAYMNLLIRERADLRDTAADYRYDVQTADTWVQRALDTKRAKSGTTRIAKRWFQVAPPPPPPAPPQAGQSGGFTGVAGSVPGGTPTTPPSRIRINGNVQAANLLSKVDPVYPPLAQQARIQGTVQMSVIVTKEGRVESVQLMSGHPLLVPAALDAVKQYVYKPTLLNGEPVGVITTVAVKFGLD